MGAILKNGVVYGGSVAQQQANWTESNPSSTSYIQNKPTLGTASSKDSTTTISDGGTDLPTAGAVYTALQNVHIDVDTTLDTTSDNPIANSAVATALNGKVDAVNGKGLSTNDYTDADQSKLSNIAAGAEVNVQSNWSETDNSSDAYIQNKPTALSAFTNDSGFITNTVNNLTNYYTTSTTYTKTEVDNLISAAKNGRFEVVAILPTTDIQTNVIYLLPKTVSQTDNVYDEYINTDGTSAGWEKIGDTQIDLSNYVQKSSTTGLIKNDGTIDTNTYAQTSDLPSAATSSALGLVKPDNSTITVDANGVISAIEVNDDSLKSTKARTTPQTNSIIKKTWVNFSSSGAHTWTDGENIYYSEGQLSNSNTQRVLDKATSTWINKTWNGVATQLYGAHIWTDGENIYHSYSTYQYVLDKSTSTWSAKTWNGLTNFNGEKVWTDGDNIYFSYQSNQYVLDKSTSTWSAKTWNGVTSFSGNYVWTDGDNIYLSIYDGQYVLDKSTSTWNSKVWSGLSGNIFGTHIWTDGNSIYYSNNGSNYVLDKSTSTWSTKVWNGLSSFSGQQIWTDGDNIYYSYGAAQYQIYTPETTNLFIDNATLVTKQSTTGLIKNDGTIDTSKHVSLQPTGSGLSGELQTKTWNGLTSFYGDYIWTDGDNIYYSLNDKNYVLDKSTSTWNTKTWYGLTSFRGDYIWKDGDNIYYSSSSDQYVLNKSTSTWSTKTWTGLTSFAGNNIWTDGTNIYYSYIDDSYVLNKATSTWSAKTWNNQPSPFVGSYVWTDGDNIYFSWNDYQYVLNKSTSTWSTKTWSGLSSFSSVSIWTDGDNIYYSDNNGNYVFLTEPAYADGFVKSDGSIDTFPKQFIASTTDLEDGVSPLETGVIYLVYEDNA